MLVTRSNPLGGRPLRPGSFPLSEDGNGNFGLKIGYHDKCLHCGKGGGEPILMKITDAESFATLMGMDLTQIKEYKKPRISLRNRLAMWLLGKKAYNKILQEGFEEIGD
jgi:hypothetical protein